MRPRQLRQCSWPAGCVQVTTSRFCSPHRSMWWALRESRGDCDWIDAAPAVAALRVLRARGWRWRQLETAARRKRTTLQELHDGRHALIRRYRAHDILAITPTWQPTMVSVPAIGSSRRVRAMMWQGWPYLDIAERVEMTVASVRNIHYMPATSARTAMTLAQLCQDWGHRPGPSGRARTWARKASAVPLAAWPEDSIDDPAAEPDLAAVRDDRPLPRNLRVIDVEEVVERRARGDSFDAIAQDLKFSPEAIRHAWNRHRREMTRREQGEVA